MYQLIGITCREEDKESSISGNQVIGRFHTKELKGIGAQEDKAIDLQYFAIF